MGEGVRHPFSRGTPEVVAIDLEAFGGTVNVTGLRVDAPAAPIRRPEARALLLYSVLPMRARGVALGQGFPRWIAQGEDAAVSLSTELLQGAP